MKPVLVRRNIGKYKRWPTHEYLCACGQKFECRATRINSGNTRSCGCLKRQLLVARNKAYPRIKHGLSGTRTYKIWVGMVQRTCNPNQSHYAYYGGRGIKVSDDWRNSFEAFYRDMGACPENMTLDRIDNDGDYRADNCKWSTRAEQLKNRRPKSLWKNK